MPVTCCLYIRIYGENDELVVVRSAQVSLAPGSEETFIWTIDDLDGSPIAEVGVELSSTKQAEGTAYLDYLTWSGTPDVVFKKPSFVGPAQRRLAGGLSSEMWRNAWVNGVDHFDWWWTEPYRIIQDEGRGLLIQGTRDWTDYIADADVTPHMATSAGLAVRVQGMRRYYALLLCDDQKLRLIKALDGDTVLAEVDYTWRFGTSHNLRLAANGNRLTASVNGQQIFDVTDGSRPLSGGGVALVCEEGRTATNVVSVRPID